tara:strand:- start:4134 stop:4298 length:165 start_codon:yes stop_codon:yes gene_type:complete
MVHSYLKKGQGKLCSNYHGETDFSKNRKLKIIKEQLEKEKLYNSYENNIKTNKE